MEEQLFVEKCSELQKNVAENSKKALQKILKEYFKENKDILYIFWDQYTPYFNDGEECEFGITDVVAISLTPKLLKKCPKTPDGKRYVPSIPSLLYFHNMGDFKESHDDLFEDDDKEGDCKETEEEEEETEETEEEERILTAEDKMDLLVEVAEEMIDSCHELKAVLQLHEDILKDMMGDHVTVWIDRNCVVKTQRYDHE